MADLKPCPFCGGEAGIDDDIEVVGGAIICCTDCQASSRVEFGFIENLEASWNSRVQDRRVDRLVAALEFYAGPHINPNDGPWGLNSHDYGATAAVALLYWRNGE